MTLDKTGTTKFQKPDVPNSSLLATTQETLRVM